MGVMHCDRIWSSGNGKWFNVVKYTATHYLVTDGIRYYSVEVSATKCYGSQRMVERAIN